VTVRLLHHYEAIGLLTPSGRTAAGYRQYSDEDLERLQQILGYRELGFSLDRIAAILAAPNGDVSVHLRRQRELLTRRIQHLQDMVAAVEFAMEAKQVGIPLTPEERFEVFGDFNPDDYAEEAEQRWGGSESYRESQRRVASYTKADWQRLKEQGGAIEQGLVAAMQGGVAADSAAAMDLAEAHRQQISRWFYDCSYEIHRGLGQMYVDDARFAAYYERIAPGLAAYLRDAIVANADRAGGK
jgi:DNA-binding transcriptional MerR regulator